MTRTFRDVMPKMAGVSLTPRLMLTKLIFILETKVSRGNFMN